MSDDEEQFNPKAHKGLLQAISNLGKTQHIRRTTRNEPVQQQQPDEFHLVKGVSKALTSRVAVNDIVKVLRRTKTHLDAGKQLKNVHSTKRVLAKPLEKPAAQRVKRAIGYDKTKTKLGRWDAVVSRNRTAEQQVFPLPEDTIFVDTKKFTKPVELAVKSDLMVEMEAAEAKLKAFRKERMGDNENEEELAKREEEQLEKKLTRDELTARRKEMAYLKMRESQKSAKARQKNKIKSKKYHKLLKKQKLQEQMKEFEMLQKTNPDAALEKLNELEKSRMLERANLRHKNTGAWAKNLQVRAKYDKDVRKDLAEALLKSRELTLKKDVAGADSDENDDDNMQENIAEMEDANYDPFNPWTRANGDKAKEGGVGSQEDENWRKYWLLRNEHEKALKEYKEDFDVAKEESAESSEETESTTVHTKKTQKPVAKKYKNKLKPPTKEVKTTLKEKQAKVELKTAVKKKKLKVKPENTDKAKEPTLEPGWSVKSINVDEKASAKFTTRDIDDIFDEQEDKIKQKIAAKLDKMQKKADKANKAANKLDNKKKKKEKDELKNLKDLTFKNEVKRVIIDEELNNEELSDAQKKSAISEASEIATATTASTTNATVEKIINRTNTSEDTIDPTKVAVVKLKQHISDFTVLDEAIEEADFDDEEEDPNAQRQMTISEAFEDDDIIADFSREKTKDSELKNAEVELSMPGWGSWAGAGLSQKTADSNKRFILNLAKKNAEEMAKRRDCNKTGIYINEEASKQLRTHLVSDIPFPFTSAQEYEASIRAPIGRNYVPETAFRALTRPAVVTKKGAIIKPMDDSELIKPPRRPNHVVDKRIAAAQKPVKKK